MSQETDVDFQKRLVQECTDEVFQVKPTDKPIDDMKKLTNIMKKYEDKIYERFIKRTTVKTLDKKNEREDLANVANASIKYPFVGDASFLTNYNRLNREGNLGQQQASYDFQMHHQQQIHQHPQQMPNDFGYSNPRNMMSPERNYVDTQASSKYYYPQDYQTQYNANLHINKPVTELPNQQSLFPNQFDRPGMADPYGYNNQQFGAPYNARNQGGPNPNALGSQNNFYPNQSNKFGAPPMNEEEFKLRRNIELLGGIEKTIPNMERSLRDNELKNIEQNFKFQNQFDNTSNNRLNTLLQNPMHNAYSPHFDSFNMRSQSPQRNEPFDLSRNQQLYMSPGQRDQTETDFRMSLYPSNQTRNPLAEKTGNTPHRLNFAPSRALRGEKAELLNLQYNISDYIASTAGGHE